MRVLFTTIPQPGHFTPLVPLARALVDVGHDVAVATDESFRDSVEKVNLGFVPAGIGDAEAWRRLTELDPDIEAVPPPERSRVIVAKLFAETFAPALLADADRLLAWKPDVVVREEGEFGGPLIAALAGVPWVDHGWGPLRPAAELAEVAQATAPLWTTHGITPHPLGGAYEWLYFDPCPPSLQSPHVQEVLVAHRIRLSASAATDHDGLPEWMNGLDRPVVYITLGTVSRFTGDLEFFTTAIAALQDQDLEIVVTVGPSGEPSALGAQASNVHVERFVPQSAILPHCVVAITNGGAGSTLGALAAGVPLLVVPGKIAPSQARNGVAVVRAGAGRVLRREDLSIDRLHEELTALLGHDEYRTAARRIAQEIQAMPSPKAVVPLIERLVAERAPLLAGAAGS